MTARRPILHQVPGFVLALLLGLLMLLAAPLSHAEAPQAAVGKGYLDHAVISHDRVLTLSGWAASYDPTSFVTSTTVWLGDHIIYRGRIGYALSRPDVSEANDNPLWQLSGFVLPVRVPDDISGTLPLHVTITTTDGQTFALSNTPQTRLLDIPPAPPSPGLPALLALALAALLPVLAWAWGRPAARWPAGSGLTAQATPLPERGAGIFGASVLLSFVLLVVPGWSGSSLSLLFQDAPVVQADAIAAFGHPQNVRIDEWLTVSPLAISQTAATPPFPSVNPLHGLHGQNMNVVGMTGVPIANPAVLAKPATWGFLLFNLRHALAWDWWLPFFGCFIACWLLLRQTFSLHWKPAALLAAGVAFSGYSVSWSGWPSYVIFFAALATWLTQRAMLTPRRDAMVGWSAAAGWAIAGLVLFLYPAWQIPLAYLLLPVFLTWLAVHWQDLRRQGTPAAPWLRLIAVGAIALLCAALLLGDWWLDGRQAIEALHHTIYPGSRLLDTGGYIDPWQLIKGLTNYVSLHESSLWSIPSDSGSYLYVLGPLFLACLLRVAELRRLPWIALTVWLFIAVLLADMFLGFPVWLARISLSGMVPAFRADIALGLAQTLVLAWLLTTDSAGEESAGWIARARGILTPLVTIAFIWNINRQLNAMPVPTQQWLTPGGWWLICGLAGLAAAWLIAGRTRQAVVLLTVWTLAVALPFNPLGIAPDHIRPEPALARAIDSLRTPGQGSGEAPRIAVVREYTWANALAASGVAVLNTTFYSPPLDLWRVLDPEGRYYSQYNRYQHLHILWSRDVDKNGFTVHAPTMDRVQLLINPAVYNFDRLPVQGLLTTTADAEALAGNPSVRMVAHDSRIGWVLFAIERHH